ncbi:MAG TPA: AmmeMemoRadiSam system protein A [Gammaproteobacteria bacterium]
MTLDADDCRALLHTARLTIEHALHHESDKPVRISGSAALNEWRASFVTLKIAGNLRGCIGTLQPLRELLDDVAHNAYAAAFRDPRFSPLAAVETAKVQIEISVLDEPETLAVADRNELLQSLRPGRDGLIVACASRRATFLPSVWEVLADSDEFVTQLWRKAGLPPGSWPADIQLLRYSVQHFHEPAAARLPRY